MFAAQCRISYVPQFNTYMVRNLHSKSMSKGKVLVMLLIHLGYSKDESNQIHYNAEKLMMVKLNSIYYSTLKTITPLIVMNRGFFVFFCFVFLTECYKTKTQ